ncbi:hypothetical protein N658DRAFT_524332 [Parathielavia hyrcaniae]|uniref:Uncharacterized protein n=1 Tax=Parathielavia hyrcaniae TaxID=113614 RepID=A0AAN6Q4K7_9PEZI|nr:hypothetical protein N658DRAFT_524332 [Parathielavia hyrcaniae]
MGRGNSSDSRYLRLMSLASWRRGSPSEPPPPPSIHLAALFTPSASMPLGSPQHVIIATDINLTDVEPSAAATAKEDTRRWSWPAAIGTDMDMDKDKDEEHYEKDAVAVVAACVPGEQAQSDESDSDVSQDSYCQFSFTNLPDHDPHRRISAAQVRAQALSMPAYVQPDRRMGCPHHFGNYQDRVPLDNSHSLIEHPLTPDGPYVSGAPPGPARIVVNAADRSTPEVIYHDPTKQQEWGRASSPFSKAAYR